MVPAAWTRAQSLRAIRWLFWAGALSALFACVDFYFQFSPPAGYEQQFVWLESGVFRRAQGFFYEASTLGNLCAFFLEMIAVTLFLRKEDSSETGRVPTRAVPGRAPAGGRSGSVVLARVTGESGSRVGGAALAASRPHPLAASGGRHR